MGQETNNITFQDAQAYMNFLQHSEKNLDATKQERIIAAAEKHGITVEFLQNNNDVFYFTIISDMSELVDDETRSRMNIAAAKADSGCVGSVGCISSAGTLSTAGTSTLSSAFSAATVASASTVDVVDNSVEHFNADSRETAAEIVDILRTPNTK